MLKGLSESRDGISRTNLIAVIVVVVAVVIAIAWVCQVYYTSMAPTPPASTPAPTPTMPPLEERFPPPPPFEVGFDLQSLEGLEVARGYEGSPGILVLRPGGSGSIGVVIASESDEDHVMSLETSIRRSGAPLSEVPKGLTGTLTPNSVYLEAGGRAGSTMTVKAERYASWGFYWVTAAASTADGSSRAANIWLLVLPYTPAYTFRADLQGGPPTPAPTPAPTPEPTRTQGLPDIEVEAGGVVHLMFLIQAEDVPSDVQAEAKLTFDWGELPETLKARFEPAPFKWSVKRIYILTVEVSPDMLEGSYRLEVHGGVGPYTFEEALYLEVKRP